MSSGMLAEVGGSSRRRLEELVTWRIPAGRALTGRSGRAIVLAAPWSSQHQRGVVGGYSSSSAFRLLWRVVRDDSQLWQSRVPRQRHQCTKGSGSAGDEEEHGEEEEPEPIETRLPELRLLLGLLRMRWAQQGDSGRPKGPGEVFLVGTGPGDPELLTVKAVRLMQQADLVLYDRLVSTDVLNLVQDRARLLYVGKSAGFHSRTQDEIHELLLNFAEAGATVLRLKGGDPLVFGRGGEEMEFLQQQGIRVQIVPGITAAAGIAAELGIPLTHRGAANSVRFLTGHSRKGGDDPLYVAEQAADPDSTLVIYMGLATLPGLAAKLLANGLPCTTPAAAVERGTTSQQRIVFATLEQLPGRVADAQLVSPTLIIIGRVVALSPLWPHCPDQKQAGAAIRDVRDRRRRNCDPLLPSQLQ